MADVESFELEDGEVPPLVVHGPSAADVQLHEAATVLRQRGQRDLARLALGLAEADLRDAVPVLNDQVRGGGGSGDFSGDPSLFDAFRHTLRVHLLNLQEAAGYDEDEISGAFPATVLDAAQHAARLALAYYDIVVDDETTAQQQQQPYRDGGCFGAVPASAAAVRSLEKQTFRADGGVTAECSICFEEFVDGGQVTVMPCPSSHVHKFHPDCISKWLAISNMCPLCRRELPAAYYE